jgi:hypothetical protein
MKSDEKTEMDAMLKPFLDPATNVLRQHAEALKRSQTNAETEHTNISAIADLVNTQWRLLEANRMFEDPIWFQTNALRMTPPGTTPAFGARSMKAC